MTDLSLFKGLSLSVFFSIFLCLLNGTAFAQSIPSSVDPGRVRPLEAQPLPNRLPSSSNIPPGEAFAIQPPSEAKNIRFILNAIQLEGATVFKGDEIEKIYSPYLNHEITLDLIWLIAGRITQHYHNEGYFLSRAYVPAQEIKDGVVSIHVLEGYIGSVIVENDAISKYSLIRQLITGIENKRPLRAHDLESFLLHLNALPGMAFRAFVEPSSKLGDGSVSLVLRDEKAAGTGLVGFDNYGSRFLGPYQGYVTYEQSFIPLQQTTLSLATTLFDSEIKYISVEHAIPVYPNWTAEFSGLYSKSSPGHTLKSNNIDGSSRDLGVDIQWQPIRQRQKNLIFSFGLSAKNTNSNILGDNPLTRDRIRKIISKLNYDTADNWRGYNYATLGLHQGIEGLGSSQKDDPNLSRAEASPNFTAIKFDYVRQQLIRDDVMAVGRISGQFASGPLYSSEELGYGGQNFGRAYDTSELTGDHGLTGSLEFRYLDLDSWQRITIIPYAFYDIGKVWNEDVDGLSQSGSSAGFGMQVNHNSGFAGNFGVAYPLTRDIDTPITSGSTGPRYILQATYQF
jgi:hemolysin activation/secretion protein